MRYRYRGDDELPARQSDDRGSDRAHQQGQTALEFGSSGNEFDDHPYGEISLPVTPLPSLAA